VSTAETGTFRLSAHSGHCAASGSCKAAAPHLLDLDSAGWVKVLDPRPSMTELDAALEAHDACPLGLIDVLDEEGNSLA
jgi:ferredoxin